MVAFGLKILADGATRPDKMARKPLFLAKSQLNSQKIEKQTRP